MCIRDRFYRLGPAGYLVHEDINVAGDRDEAGELQRLLDILDNRTPTMDVLRDVQEPTPSPLPTPPTLFPTNAPTPPLSFVCNVRDYKKCLDRKCVWKAYSCHPPKTPSPTAYPTTQAPTPPTTRIPTIRSPTEAPVVPPTPRQLKCNEIRSQASCIAR